MHVTLPHSAAPSTADPLPPTTMALRMTAPVAPRAGSAAPRLPARVLAGPRAGARRAVAAAAAAKVGSGGVSRESARPIGGGGGRNRGKRCAAVSRPAPARPRLTPAPPRTRRMAAAR